ncbi:MAG: D-glycero-beta-D-manno-heptose 1-phosphate adenylyltransferase [Thermodesulfovibrionales bacterium]|nr:D-glycero-beta-D-manno-heptose 1-phosphate adenylyltransferase [Thermodesulfovibrionales bacterium]
MALFVSQDTLKRLVLEIQSYGKKVVFTNGCFDIIHVGHVRYLKEAKSLGDYLIVAVNSDASVSRLKPNRPINDASSRVEVLLALQCIDFVTIFEEDTPYNLIKLLKPNILVKGGDWSIDNIVGADIVDNVCTLTYHKGCSTTEIIQKIRRLPLD